MNQRRPPLTHRLKKPAYHSALGPGLVTGAADDDPSGIATYSQAGAAYGFALLWPVVLAWPFLTAFQFTCAEIARVTGKGLAANLATHLPRGVVWAVVVLLLGANIFNIAADIAAMGEAARLVTGVPRLPLMVGFAVLSLGLQIFVPYHRYVGLLKWLTLSLFAYVLVVLAVGVNWRDVLGGLWPSLPAGSATTVVAILGTTISPYLFFWQSAQELEEMNLEHARPLLQRPRAAPRELTRLVKDSAGGFLVTMTISLCIIAATAATLHGAGTTTIATAADAAAALRPIAGDFAFALFALGIIGTGLLAVPVLAGSAAYALSEVMGWRAGLELKPREAAGFYGVIFVAVSAALALDIIGIDPMKALFWTAVVNGLVAVPVMLAIMLLASRRAVMGNFRARGAQALLGWGAVVLMALSAAGMFLL
ncbi:divalent metal cation transporter [Sandarakinorhabdus sp.]|jgi:NRAMP (natural resistance-associated macrophage protein)-like metal ion transporter|uniref:NRAMP family divalent metal transporter n=1 Tax=Sandarakinorhabdus sp. TaxID=1916663 RepID=UPI0028AE2367|nr:divalent metal cation transporter [Sandarakinorhabdus sp.]